MYFSPEPAAPHETSPGRGWVLAALWATPPLLFLGYLHVFGAAMATASGDPTFQAAYDLAMPWVLWAGMGSVALFIVLCALLVDLPDGRYLARRWVAQIQLGLLVLPTVLIQALPSP